MFAFWAIVIATIATVFTIVTIPALYSAAYNLNSELLQESNFCRLQIRDFWSKIYSLGISVNNLKWKRETVLKQNNNRKKRHWLFGKWIPPTNVEQQHDSSGYSFDSVVNNPNDYTNKKQQKNSNFDDKKQYGFEISHKVIIKKSNKIFFLE